MTASSPLSHRFEVSGGLSLIVVRELTAVVVGGWVEEEEVGEGTFLFSFCQRHQVVEIHARLRHPNSRHEFYRAFNPLYNLMAGLLEAGCRVQVEGEWAALMPTGHFSGRPLAVRPIFQHQLPPLDRAPDLDPAQVEEAVRDLPGRKNYQREAEREWRHANGIKIYALNRKAHRLFGSEPLSCRLMTDYFQKGPLPASSWGEVWVGYWVGLGSGRPAALHLFPEEVGLVSDVSVHRYAIADRSTLRDLSVLDFGSGPPLLHPCETWLKFATQCGQRADYAMALRCCEQAGLCALPGQEDLVARETAHWQEWQAYRPASAEPGPKLKIRSLTDLIDLIGFEKQLRDLAEDVDWEIQEAHDYRRQPQLLTHRLSYPVVTGKELLAAGVTPRVLDRLGLGYGPIPPPARYETIFQLRLGGWLLWGTVESATILLAEEPLVLYKLI